MVAYGKRKVLLRGSDFVVQVETGVAGETIKPGYLVDGVTTILKHATAGGVAPYALALERDEMGAGIDDVYSNDPALPDAAYAIGDVVKIGLCHSGIQFTGWIGSGQVIIVNDRMESTGNGTFRKFGSGTILARALETLSPLVETKLKMEWM